MMKDKFEILKANIEVLKDLLDQYYNLFHYNDSEKLERSASQEISDSSTEKL